MRVCMFPSPLSALIDVSAKGVGLITLLAAVWTGSAVVAARLVRDLMRLALLLHRRYPPYGKWLGSAFAALPAAATLS
jgi:hypothetical protein